MSKKTKWQMNLIITRILWLAVSIVMAIILKRKLVVKSILNSTLDYNIVYTIAWIMLGYYVFAIALVIWNLIAGWEELTIYYRLEGLVQLLLSIPCFYIMFVPRNKVLNYIDTHYKVRSANKKVNWISKKNRKKLKKLARKRRKNK